MSLIQAVVLGLVQGVTEFIPVSSSAHLVLFPHLFGWKDQGLAYDVALHWGTLAALILYFRGDILSLAKGALGRGEKNAGRLAWGIVLATIPAAAAGVFLDDYVETIFRRPERIAGALILFGILLGIADRLGRKEGTLETVDWKIALGIGCAQALAIMPGVSRSGSTITAALLLGLSRVEAARYSFLLGIPVIMGAGILKIRDISPEMLDAVFFLGIAVSFISGYGAIRFLLGFLSKKGLTGFAVYRVALGLTIIAFALAR